jgi:hypothetical protein
MLAGNGSAAFRTGANPANVARRTPIFRRHPYSWLGGIIACCAIAETLAPGSSEAATNRPFSSALQRRRPATDLISEIALSLTGPPL